MSGRNPSKLFTYGNFFGPLDTFWREVTLDGLNLYD